MAWSIDLHFVYIMSRILAAHFIYQEGEWARNTHLQNFNCTSLIDQIPHVTPNSRDLATRLKSKLFFNRVCESLNYKLWLIRFNKHTSLLVWLAWIVLYTSLHVVLVLYSNKGSSKTSGMLSILTTQYMNVFI